MSSLGMNITYGSLLRFAIPTILSYIFLNIYFIIDGLFVSYAVGPAGLAAVNIVMPVLLMTLALATMIGTGGSAWVAARLGRRETEEARQDFSLLVISCIIGSVFLSVLGLCFMEPVLYFLGADEGLYGLCAAYAVPLFLSSPSVMGGMVMDSFLLVEGHPRLAMMSSFLGGFLNVTLDYLFLIQWGWGLEGAAIATGIGYSLSAVIAVSYFVIWRKGTLRFTVPVLRWHVLKKAMGNGCSEMVSILAMSVIIIVMNQTMMHLAGHDGVAAVSIVQYVQELLTAVYLGYSEGVAPLTSFNYGERNKRKLYQIYRFSLQIIAGFAVFTFLGGLMIAGPIVGAFTGEDREVYQMAVHGFRIYAAGFLFVGFNTYAASLFTALNDGRTSAFLALCHTMVFLLGMLLLLPRIFGVDGVWLATPIAEVLSLLVSFWFFRTRGSRWQISTR